MTSINRPTYLKSFNKREHNTSDQLMWMTEGIFKSYEKVVVPLNVILSYS